MAADQGRLLHLLSAQMAQIIYMPVMHIVSFREENAISHGLYCSLDIARSVSPDTSPKVNLPACEVTHSSMQFLQHP